MATSLKTCGRGVIIHGKGNKFYIDIEADYQNDDPIQTLEQEVGADDLGGFIREKVRPNEIIRLLTCANLDAAKTFSKALPEYTVYATDDIVRLHPDGGITTIARSGNATQRWRKLKAGIEIGDAPTPKKPAQAFENVFVEMGVGEDGIQWKKVELGSTDLSKMTMQARKNAPNSDVTRNFATIEYEDLNGNILYKSFRSEASGLKGHTETQIIKFMDDNNLPMTKLLKLHTELIPCEPCTIALVNRLKNTNAKITWDFDSFNIIDRENYIKTLK